MFAAKVAKRNADEYNEKMKKREFGCIGTAIKEAVSNGKYKLELYDTDAYISEYTKNRLEKLGYKITFEIKHRIALLKISWEEDYDNS